MTTTRNITTKTTRVGQCEEIDKTETVIETNDRFDRLTNLDIKTHYRDIEIYCMPSSFVGAFAYWAHAQNEGVELLKIANAILDFNKYVLTFFENPKIPVKFSYSELSATISEEEFQSIPGVLEIMEGDNFICCGALVRNVFYMILREHITQD